MTTWDWQTLLATPQPGQHIAQLYDRSDFLARAVSHYLGTGLRAGAGALVVATPAHWSDIRDALTRDGLDVGAREVSGQLCVLDAAECLRGLLVDGWPDRARFRALIDSSLERMRARGYAELRVFGEMVDLLRRSSVPATLELEMLWEEPVRAHGVALLCGYSVNNLDRYSHHSIVQGVARAHSDLIPTEDTARLQRAVEGAYRDVFGDGAETDLLRRTLLAQYEPPARMPEAEAAILAVRELVPSVADLLLDRVRDRYESTDSR